MPKGKASSALTNLLSNSSSPSKTKKSEPTMLEQLMSGKTITKPESPRGNRILGFLGLNRNRLIAVETSGKILEIY